MSFSYEELAEIRHYIHQHPELSGQEYQTTAFLRERLEELGIRILESGLKTGLIAEIGSGQPVVALRADIDALPILEQTNLPYQSQNPGVMHACGHDFHQTSLLGAAALGDIGKHFPDTDPAYKGASSIELLKHVGKLIDEKLYVIGNIDATIIAQRPKMAPHIEQMRKNVAEALHIDVDQVNIKATTEEGLGFTGTGEGISSQAIASLDTIANYSYQVGPQTGGCAGCGGCPNVGK